MKRRQSSRRGLISKRSEVENQLIFYARKTLDYNFQNSGRFYWEFLFYVLGPYYKDCLRALSNILEAEDDDLASDVRVRPKRTMAEAASRRYVQPERLSSTLESYLDDGHDSRPIKDAVAHYLKQAARHTPGKYESKFLDLKKYLDLTDAEVRFLDYLYIRDSFEPFARIEANIMDIDTADFHQFICDLSPSEYSQILSRDGNLYGYNLIESGRRHFNHAFELSERLKEFVINPGTLEDLGYIPEYRKKTFALDSFSVSETDKNIILRLLQSESANILIYGPPGTGKTEFSRAIIKAAGQKIYSIDEKEDSSDRSLGRKILFVSARKNRKCQQNTIIFDEADELFPKQKMSYFEFLQSDKPDIEKAWINNILDTKKGRTIFIMNDGDQILEAVKRRFDYILQIPASNMEDRIVFWNHCLKGKRLKRILKQKDIELLASRFELDAGGIAVCIATFEKAFPDLECKDSLVELQNILTNHLQEVKGKDPLPVKSDTGKYNPNSLNTDMDIPAVIKSIKYYQDSKARGESTGSFCLLFHGKPGTGKTEFVHYIARQLKIDLLAKKGSDLLSPLVGMTEKLIRRTFNQAEKNNAIFFLDEADTFLGNREQNSQRWQTSQTNEFLTRMESFSGIFIASTNLLDTVDKAALRRFHIKASFFPMQKDKFATMFATFFPQKRTTLEKDNRLLQRLLAIEGLTPGDFAAVHRKYEFSNPEGYTAEDLVEALEQEASYKDDSKGNRIGFA